MSLRFAILGFLSTTPATGYELGRQFNSAFGSVWEALPSQIYPELRELEKAGWIEGRVLPEDRLNRRIYRLTDSGEAALLAWVEADNDYPPERDAERVRLILLDHSAPETVKRHLERHLEHNRQRLAVWQAIADGIEDGSYPRLRARLKGRPEAQHDLIVGLKLLAFGGNAERAQFEIDWALRALAWLDSLERRSSDEEGAVLPLRRMRKN